MYEDRIVIRGAREHNLKDVDLELWDGGGRLARGIAVDTNVDEVVANYVATTTGTYYARVSGEAGVDYSLLVTRNAGFDVEENSDFG